MTEYKNKVKVEMPLNGKKEDIEFNFEVKISEDAKEEVDVYISSKKYLKKEKISSYWFSKRNYLYFLVTNQTNKIDEQIISYIKDGFMREWIKIAPQKKMLTGFKRISEDRDSKEDIESLNCKRYTGRFLTKESVCFVYNDGEKEGVYKLKNTTKNIKSKIIYEKLKKLQPDNKFKINIGYEDRNYLNILSDISCNVIFDNNFSKNNYNSRDCCGNIDFDSINFEINIKNDKLQIEEKLIIESKDIEKTILEFINDKESDLSQDSYFTRRGNDFESYFYECFGDEVVERYIIALNNFLNKNYVTKKDNIITPLYLIYDKILDIKVKNSFDGTLEKVRLHSNIKYFVKNNKSNFIFRIYEDIGYRGCEDDRIIYKQHLSESEFVNYIDINIGYEKYGGSYKNLKYSDDFIYNVLSIYSNLIENCGSVIESVSGYDKKLEKHIDYNYSDFISKLSINNVQEVNINQKLDYINKYCKLFIIDNSKQKATIQFKFKNGDNVGNGKQEFFGDNLIDEVYKFILNNDICIVE